MVPSTVVHSEPSSHTSLCGSQVSPTCLTGGGVVDIDLCSDGPHGLVAGTTGSGKSELLRTLVVSLALHHPPDRLTFLLVDYKGGAAFRGISELPHVVGLVTDLSPHLVRRALTSLRAELRHREHLLNRISAPHEVIETLLAAGGRAEGSLPLA